MKTVEYKTMSENEKSYWWHVGRLKIIDEQLAGMFPKKDAKILNVGCGTGGTIKTIEKYAAEIINVDVSEEAIKYMKKAGYTAHLIDGIKLPFKAGEFDAVVAFDVLEHIENDNKALKEWKRVIKPGGFVFITVPAYRWLWSGHDESLFHFRRYTAGGLKLKAEAAGLKTKKASYMIVFSLPLVAGFRLLHKAMRKKAMTEETSYVAVPKVVNTTFIGLLNVEAKLQRVGSFPMGTSVIGLFKK